MSIVRRSRRKAIIGVVVVAVALGILFAGLTATGPSFVAELSEHAAILVAAVGIAGVLLLLFQELTDRIEHH